MKNVFRKIHLWLSIPFGIVISLTCFSGAMLVFEKEVTELIQRHLYKTEVPADGTPVITQDQALALVQSALGHPASSTPSAAATQPAPGHPASSTPAAASSTTPAAAHPAPGHPASSTPSAATQPAAGHPSSGGAAGGEMPLRKTEVPSWATSIPADAVATEVVISPEPNRTWQVKLSKPRRTVVFVDQYTGSILGASHRPAFFTTMFKLHRWLLGTRPTAPSTPNHTATPSAAATSAAPAAAQPARQADFTPGRHSSIAPSTSSAAQPIPDGAAHATPGRHSVAAPSTPSAAQLTSDGAAASIADRHSSSTSALAAAKSTPDGAVHSTPSRHSAAAQSIPDGAARSTPSHHSVAAPSTPTAAQPTSARPSSAPAADGGGIFWGKLIVGVSTLLFVFVLISGIVIWWPRTRQAWKSRIKISVSNGWKRFWHDLHVAGGIYVCLLLLVMALTGLTWSFEWYRNGFYSLLGSVLGSGDSGELRRLVYSLHTGSWGGMFTRILYFLAALLGASLPITGYWLWIRRLRHKH